MRANTNKEISLRAISESLFQIMGFKYNHCCKLKTGSGKNGKISHLKNMARPFKGRTFKFEKVHEVMMKKIFFIMIRFFIMTP